MTKHKNQDPQAKSTNRVQRYRQRLKERGLRVQQNWVYDTSSEDFIQECNRQVKFARVANDGFFNVASLEKRFERGEIITVRQIGLGKTWEALVVQSELFAQAGTISVLPLSAGTNLYELSLLRPRIKYINKTGTRVNAQVMIDKIQSVLEAEAEKSIGEVSAEKMQEVDRCLGLFLGIFK